ncbi:barstar family protein [Lewinella sp. IMCC34191]|uniref:barstar family protein n=1 Tax=Lewinella sp. IMCC34191 TaxID=2259172 RepID=UPI000E25ECBC|nr:barstar family protein [Lewinella sp. IMCC34191]
MRTIELDGTAFDDLEGFYNEVERKLTSGLDWRVGHNLDAFNDILYGGFGVHEPHEAVNLIWRHSGRSQQVLGWPETEKYWATKVRTFHPNNRHIALARLESAKRQDGPTLYEMLCSIIREHPSLTLMEE